MIMAKIDKKILVPTVLFCAAFIYASLTVYGLKEKEVSAKLDVIRTDSPIVFYFGVSCPHCKNVEKYLEENQVAEKVSFSMKEVYNNRDNANEAIEKAALCGIDKKNLGVPFLWDGDKCYVGDENIISFFKTKMEESEAAPTSTDEGNIPSEEVEPAADKQ